MWRMLLLDVNATLDALRRLALTRTLGDTPRRQRSEYYRRGVLACVRARRSKVGHMAGKATPKRGGLGGCLFAPCWWRWWQRRTGRLPPERSQQTEAVQVYNREAENVHVR